MEFGEEDFLETFFERSVDHVIYRDYIVNRRFLIYCSLACNVQDRDDVPAHGETAADDGPSRKRPEEGFW